MAQDYSNIEVERCGICMDIVVDRGVLDCCQHWYITSFQYCYCFPGFPVRNLSKAELKYLSPPTYSLML